MECCGLVPGPRFSGSSLRIFLLSDELPVRVEKLHVVTILTLLTRGAYALLGFLEKLTNDLLPIFTVLTITLTGLTTGSGVVPETASFSILACPGIAELEARFPGEACPEDVLPVLAFVSCTYGLGHVMPLRRSTTK